MNPVQKRIFGAVSASMVIVLDHSSKISQVGGLGKMRAF